MDVREPILSPLELGRQLEVIDPHQMQRGRMQVVDVHRILRDRVAQVVGRSDRDALQMDAGGSGTVLAIFSVDAFQFDELTRNGHWDFAALGGPNEGVKNDPLADLLEIANNMARTSRFDYDAATYVVQSNRYAADGDGGYGHVGIHLGVGYYPFGFGFGYGYPFYDPFGFMPFWGGWYGGYGYGYWGYGYGGYPSYRYPVSHGPVVFTGGGGFTRKAGGGFTRYTPIEPRGRDGFSDPFSVRDRGLGVRSRSVEPRTIKPQSAPHGFAPRAGPSRPSFSGSRPSISRGFSRSFGGISRTFGSVSGARGGFSTGGRRH